MSKDRNVTLMRDAQRKAKRSECPILDYAPYDEREIDELRQHCVIDIRDAMSDDSVAFNRAMREYHAR